MKCEKQKGNQCVDRCWERCFKRKGCSITWNLQNHHVRWELRKVDLVWYVGNQKQLLERDRYKNGIAGGWRGCEMGEGDRVEVNNLYKDFWQWRVTAEPKLETMHQDHFYMLNQLLWRPLLNADLVLFSKSAKRSRERLGCGKGGSLTPRATSPTRYCYNELFKK